MGEQTVWIGDKISTKHHCGADPGEIELIQRVYMSCRRVETNQVLTAGHP